MELLSTNTGKDRPSRAPCMPPDSLRLLLCLFILSVSGCLYPFPDSNPESLLSVLLVNPATTTSTTGSTLNSIQSGVADLSATNSSVISINAVDLSKAFVVCSLRTNSGLPQYLPLCQLTGATSLQIDYDVCCANVFVAWYVVEFSSGVSVQRGFQTVAVGDLTHNLGLSSAVDTGKSFPIIQTRANSSNNDRDEQINFTVDINGPTNMLLSRNETGLSVEVAWQLIQMDAATVHSGSVNLSGATGVNQPISTVTPAQSFAVLTTAGAAVNNGNDAMHNVRAYLNASTLTLSRGTATNNVDVHYYIVDTGGLASIQRGTNTTASAGTTSITAIPAASFDATRCFPINTASVDTAVQQREQSDFSALIGSGQMQLTRGNNLVNSTVDWQLIEF